MSNRLILGLTAAILVVGLAIIVYVSRDGGKAPSWRQHSARLEELDTEMKALLENIKGAHGAGQCEADAECKVVGLGQKTCGGYGNFLIYSTHDADEETLLGLVEKYNDKAEEFNNLSLQVPPCGQKPQAIVCVHGDCVPRD